ncbi:hypothetical protein BJX99DRAFT_169330 [Aspergillus californicus]
MSGVYLAALVVGDVQKIVVMRFLQLYSVQLFMYSVGLLRGSQSPECSIAVTESSGSARYELNHPVADWWMVGSREASGATNGPKSRFYKFSPSFFLPLSQLARIFTIVFPAHILEAPFLHHLILAIHLFFSLLPILIFHNGQGR